MLGAFWECRLYLIPQWQHFTVFLILTGTLILLNIGVGMFSADLLTNKIFLAKPLNAWQASALLLEPSRFVDVPELSAAARLELRTIFLILIAILMGLAFFAGQALGYYQTWILQRVNQHLREVMMRNAVQLSLRYHNKNQVGDAIYRVFQDSAMVTAIIETGLLEPVILLGSFAIVLGVLFAFDPYLAALVILALIPSLTLLWFATYRLRTRSRLAREANSNLTSHIQESMQGGRLLKALVAEESAFRRFVSRSRTALDRAYELRKTVTLLNLGVYFCSAFITIFTDYLMVNWVWEGRETLGYGVVAFVGFAIWDLGAFQNARGNIEGASGSMVGMANTWSLLQDMGMGLHRALHLLHVKPDVQDNPNAREVPDGSLTVEFDRVAFAYEADQEILQDVSFRAEPGTITAIVGSSGAGKTTLMNLLLRLYDVDGGTVKVGGVDVRDLAQDSLRSAIAMVLQENALFPTTIEDNIRYAAPDASAATLTNAIATSCVDEFLEDLPNGLQTELGERGAKLSTGQRQRISIARALVKDAPILVLDEPTAALDVRTEQQVIERIRGWAEDKVVLLITHRIAQATQADQVVYLAEGTVVEQGEPAELLSRDDSRFQTFIQAENSVAA